MQASQHQTDSPLHQKILETYLKNSQLLKLGKRFHFYSRMFLWTNSAPYKAALDSLETFFNEDLKVSIEKAKNPSIRYPKKFQELRKESIEKYFWITSYTALLFKWLFFRTIYKKDIKNEVLSVASEDTLLTLAEDILNDPTALARLSTISVNFLYLVRGVTQQNIFNPHRLLEKVLPEYSDTQLYSELSLYFFTHCVIGESEFYLHPIQRNLDVYTNMLKKSEGIIMQHFDSVSIDNKVEFLVASKLCNRDSALFERIQEECKQNFSPELGYITEPRKLAQDQDIDSSEHRNALCIMSNTDPHFS